MGNRISSPDRIDLEVSTTAIRDAIPFSKRKWGMKVPVYNDGVSSGIYELVYNASSTDKSDNANWVLKPDTKDWNNGIASFNGAINQGVVFCQGAGTPVGAAVCNVIVARSGTSIWQHAIVISGGGVAGNIYYRNSLDGGGSWNAWVLVNA